MARISIKTAIISRNKPLANSDKNMAIKVPRGITIIIAHNVVKYVPHTRGMTPNLREVKSGVHCVPVKNSIIETSLKNGIEPTNIIMNTPRVMREEQTAHKKKNLLRISSFIIIYFFKHKRQ